MWERTDPGVEDSDKKPWRSRLCALNLSRSSPPDSQISERILARASASRYAPSHGSWEAQVSGPSHANPTAPRTEWKWVCTIDNRGFALWEIINAFDNQESLCMIFFLDLTGLRAHNLLEYAARAASPYDARGSTPCNQSIRYTN